MIRIAICDDEKHMSNHIRAMASDFFRKKNREIQLRTFLRNSVRRDNRTR